MKNTSMFRRLWLVAIPLALATPALASICPGTPTSLSPGFTNPTGCTVGNNQFSNFAVGVVPIAPPPTVINGVTLVDTNWGFPPTASTIALNAFGDGIQLSTPPNTCLTHSDPSNNFQFCVQGKIQTLASTITYDLHAISGTISQMVLDGTVVSHTSGGAGATAAVFREFCLGLTTFDQTCGGDPTKYRVLQVGAVNGNFTTLSQSASTFFSGVTDIAIRDTVYLQTDNGEGSFAQVLNFDLLTTPEPATLGLVGLALAGFGALRFRKRKV